MAQNSDGEQPSQTLAVPPEEETLVQEAVEEVFADLENALPTIEGKLQQFESTADSYPVLTTVLQSMWNFCEAIRLIQGEADFVRGSELLEGSAHGFERAGLEKLRDLSVGLGVYSMAVVQLQALNIGQGLELLAQVKGYLRSAGQYGGAFEPMIEHMEPEALYTAGIQALLSLDYASGKTLLDRASQAAERVSDKYYEEGEPLYYTYQGMARFFGAYYTFVYATNAFFRFEYDKLAAEEDLANEAKQARDLLGSGYTAAVSLSNLSHLSEGFVQVLDLVSELAELMLTVLHSTFKPDLQTLALLRQKARAATNSFSQAGPQSVGLVRYSDQLADQIDNLERLAKPSRKDFGAFSGLVACALFLPLFLAVSWANSIFLIGLEASKLITTCAVLALIGGFGFGALRFKSLILPTLGEKGGSKDERDTE